MTRCAWAVPGSDPDPLVTANVSLEEVPETFDRLGRPNDHRKVLTTPAA